MRPIGASFATPAWSRAMRAPASARSRALRRHGSGSSAASASRTVRRANAGLPHISHAFRATAGAGFDRSRQAMTTAADHNPTRDTRTGMTQPNLDELLKAGVHFGHQTRRWNPKMRRFIFAERNGIHIIDLQKTLRQLEIAQKLVREVILRGDNVLFVCTKRQLAAIVQAEAERCGSQYVTERWL